MTCIEEESQEKELKGDSWIEEYRGFPEKYNIKKISWIEESIGDSQKVELKGDSST